MSPGMKAWNVYDGAPPSVKAMLTELCTRVVTAPIRHALERAVVLHLFPLMLALPEPSGAQSYLRIGDAVAGPNVAADASDFFVSSQSQTQVGDKACTTRDDNFVAFTHGVSRNACGNEAVHETKATTDKAIVGGVICSPLLSLAASPVSPASFLSCSPPSASLPLSPATQLANQFCFSLPSVPGWFRELLLEPIQLCMPWEFFCNVISADLEEHIHPVAQYLLTEHPPLSFDDPIPDEFFIFTDGSAKKLKSDAEVSHQDGWSMVLGARSGDDYGCQGILSDTVESLACMEGYTGSYVAEITGMI